MNSIERILVLSPHTDDGEVGAGGTIARLVKEEKEVYLASFSFANKSLPEGFANYTTAREEKHAALTLGIPLLNVITYDFEVRRFPSVRQEILEEMVRLRKEINPDLVIIPSSYDTHQDHKTIYEEGFRAFKRSCILGYEIPWNNVMFITNFYSVLTADQLEKKIRAVDCYKSQIRKIHRGFDYIGRLACVRGHQIQADYAEAFEVIRWIM